VHRVFDEQLIEHANLRYLEPPKRFLPECLPKHYFILRHSAQKYLPVGPTAQVYKIGQTKNGRIEDTIVTNLAALNVLQN
jgi:hypothetical protein